MKTRFSIIIAASLLLTGCYHVPATRIAFDPVKKTFTVQSPKDVELKGVTLTVAPDKSVSVKIEQYSSKNNFEVVNAVANANIASQKNIIAGLEKVLQAAGGAVVP